MQSTEKFVTFEVS